MSCINHPDKAVVGKCNECGVGLCEECLNYFEESICYECAKKRLFQNKKYKKKAMITLAIGGIIGLILGLFVGGSFGELCGFLVGVSILGSIWGFLAGASFGLIVLFSKGEGIRWYMYIITLIFSISGAPIVFILKIINLIQINKSIKEESELIEKYPFNNYVYEK